MLLSGSDETFYLRFNVCSPSKTNLKVQNGVFTDPTSLQSKGPLCSLWRGEKMKLLALSSWRACLRVAVWFVTGEVCSFSYSSILYFFAFMVCDRTSLQTVKGVISFYLYAAYQFDGFTCRGTMLAWEERSLSSLAAPAVKRGCVCRPVSKEMIYAAASERLGVFSHEGRLSTCSLLLHQLETGPSRVAACRAGSLFSRWTRILDVMLSCSSKISHLLEMYLMFRKFPPLMDASGYFFPDVRNRSTQFTKKPDWIVLFIPVFFHSSTVSFLPAPMIEPLQFPQSSSPCVSQQHPGQQYAGSWAFKPTHLQ